MTVFWISQAPHGTPTLDFYRLTKSKLTKGTRCKGQAMLDGYATEGGTRKICKGFLSSWQIQFLETMAMAMDVQELAVPTGNSNKAKNCESESWFTEILQLLVRLFLCLPLVAGWSRDTRPSSGPPTVSFVFVDYRDGYYSTRGQTWIRKLMFALLCAPMTPAETRCQVSVWKPIDSDLTQRY